jgi:hypothetical protein
MLQRFPHSKNTDAEMRPHVNVKMKAGFEHHSIIALTGSRAPSFPIIQPLQPWYKYLKGAASDTVNDHGLLQS